MLDIPYHSQEESDATRFANDCGVACSAMILEWLGKGRKRIDDLALTTSLAVDASGLNPLEIVKLLKNNGVASEFRSGVQADDLLADVEKRQKPVIALIRYGDIPERQNQADVNGGHFVLVVGSDDNNVYFNDPDFWGAQKSKGKGLAVKRQEFKNALANAKVFKPGYAVFLKDDPPAMVATTPAPTAATTGNGTASGAVPATSTSDSNTNSAATPLDHTIPVGAAHVSSDGLNLRKAAGGDPIKTLGHNTNVTILADAPVHATLSGKDFVWVHISTTDADGWCVESFLATGNA